MADRKGTARRGSRPLRRHLATPRGQAHLFGVTFLLALAVAVAAAVARPLFEGLIEEKYPPPTEATAELMSQLERGEQSAEQIRECPDGDFAALYQGWMTAPAGAFPRLPSVMAQADAVRAARLLVRTWHTGSDEQRSRALDFLHAAQAPAIWSAVDEARRSSRPAGPQLQEAFAEGRTAAGGGQ